MIILIALGLLVFGGLCFLWGEYYGELIGWKEASLHYRWSKIEEDLEEEHGEGELRRDT